MNYTKNKIITIIVVSLLIIIFSGCINNEIIGTYVHETGAFFILNGDQTFYETFSDGNTASGTYTIASPSGNLTMVYAPFGSFIVMEKIENGYQNKHGGIYRKK